jgi:hypothetical protein
LKRTIDMLALYLSSKLCLSGVMQIIFYLCSELYTNNRLICSDGGYFNAIMSFPQNYPNSPPSVRFTSEMWHPNGQLFISINFTFLQ